jgi:hypothetical protein
MVQHIFAMVDDYISDELRVKFLTLIEVRGASGYRHSIIPHVEQPQRLAIFVSESPETNLQKMNLTNGPIYLWRTLYTVRHGSVRVPILDSDSRCSIPGEYIHRAPIGLQACIDYLDKQTMIRTNMMCLWPSASAPAPSAPAPSAPAPPLTQIPKFVTDALKRDAISTNYLCPITMEPLSDAAITSCYHIFDRESIVRSLRTSRVCPMCREVVTFTQPI